MSFGHALMRPARRFSRRDDASRWVLRACGLFALFCLAIVILLAGRDWVVQRRIVLSDPDSIAAHPQFASFASSRGRKVFSAHCAACHGVGGKGDASIGVPDLTDADYLYGDGRVSEIEDIVRHGIRSGDRRGRNFAYMPAYASLHPYATEPIPPLTPPELQDVVQFLLGFAGHSPDVAAALRGKAIFLGKGGCYDCHGADAKGDPAIGAPNLTDAIWLYGNGSAETITDSIEHGRRGYSPAYKSVLNAAETRDVAVFVASLSQPAHIREARQ